MAGGSCGSSLWALDIAYADRDAVMKKADAVFAVINGTPPDEGVAVELGLAIAHGKPTFLFRDDFRKCADSNLFACNLMLYSGLPREGWAGFVYNSIGEITNPKKALARWVDDWYQANIKHGCEKYHEWFCADTAWLRSEIASARLAVERGDIKSVVVCTHHAPLTEDDAVCKRARPARSGGLGTAAYGCEGTNLYTAWLEKDDPVVKAWCYGHTHKCFSTRHGTKGTLVMSNPMGHPGEAAEGEFCPCCVLTVGGGGGAAAVAAQRCCCDEEQTHFTGCRP